jgi:hypothetical protein
MRTTLRIDDDLLSELKQLADSEDLPLTDLVNRVLRQGLTTKPAKRRAYREKTFSMGQPKVDLDKALSLAASLEDDEVIRKLALRK